mmetsp:Transcript_31415/g.57041  ORF Transcript_31415/g.57041 Transcript_31415/m.57041 type:complete len:238 (+) Transcript_31415:897-1610(+)
MELGGMASRLNGICTIKGIAFERHVQEITTHNLSEGINSLRLVKEIGPVNLVLVDGNTRNLGTTSRGDGAHGTTDATTYIQRLHTRLKAESGGDASLVSSLRRLYILMRKARRKMERLAPTPFINISDKGVENVDEVNSLGSVGNANTGLRTIRIGVVLEFLLNSFRRNRSTRQLRSTGFKLLVAAKGTKKVERCRSTNDGSNSLLRGGELVQLLRCSVISISGIRLDSIHFYNIIV